MAGPRCILFDFDMTLADSSRGAWDCINYALQRLGLPPVSLDQALRTIGLSLGDTLASFLVSPDRDQVHAFHGYFVERADQVMAELTVLYPTTQPTVDTLRGQARALGIVSTKFRYRIETILTREGLLDRFDTIVGGEDVDEHKPDPAGLLLALERLGCGRDECVYVGDSLVDAETARRAGVPFAAVLTGGADREAFAGYAALGLLDSLDELPPLLAS